MMLKDFWFKIRNRRNEHISEEIRKDLEFFLDLNYIPEELEREATGALYDAHELSRTIEPEEDFYTSYDYLPGKSAEEFEDDYTEIGAPFSGKSVTEFSGRLASAPQKPAADGSARPDSVQSPQVLQRQSLDDVISALGMTFQQKLLTLIDAKGYSDPQVYRKANLDRKLFSKIRCNADYKPSKLTALALAIALELNLDEATDLLGRAGLALSPSSLTDMIVKYCITNQIYDIYDVNALLYEHDQQLLGL